MNAYTPNDKIDCYIVVPPQYRPQIYTGVSFLNGNNLRAQITFSTRSNENLIEKASGGIDVFRLGDERKDMSLKIVGSDTETELVIEEIIKRRIPVYLYPRCGGNLQLSAPLVRGLGVDPVDGATATFTLTIADGTTVYLPRGDSGHGVYLEEIDTSAPLIDGLWTTNGVQSQLPAGRGMPFMGAYKNLLKDSLMTEIAHAAPYSAGLEWGAYTSASDVWGTDHGSRDSIHCADAKSYWTTSTTTTYRSWGFSLVSASYVNISVCYRVNDTMSIKLKTSGGSILWSQAISAGSGRIQRSWLSNVTCAGAYLEFTLITGSFLEVDCPQIIHNTSVDVVEYQPFLGTSSSAEAEITGNNLTIDCDMGADSIATTATASSRDGAILASGYVQPMFSDDYSVTGSTFAEMISYSGSIKARLDYDSSFGFGLATDGVIRDRDTISDHELGDIYAWGLFSGYNNGVAATRLYAIRLRDKEKYVCNYASATMFMYRIILGNDVNTTNEANAVLQAVTVEAATWSDCKAAVNRLADSHVRNIIRNTIGRQYLLDRNISPKKYKSDANTGTLSATEVKAV